MFLGHRELTKTLCHCHPERQTLNKCLVQSRWMHQQTELKTEHITRGGQRLA
jgi:hypothetical protein